MYFSGTVICDNMPIINDHPDIAVCKNRGLSLRAESET